MRDSARSKHWITNAADLVIGTRYTILTDEPSGVFEVGAFRGWLFKIDQHGHNQEEEFVTELPAGWEARFPSLVFERARVANHYMLSATETPTAGSGARSK